MTHNKLLDLNQKDIFNIVTQITATNDIIFDIELNEDKFEIKYLYSEIIESQIEVSEKIYFQYNLFDYVIEICVSEFDCLITLKENE